MADNGDLQKKLQDGVDAARRGDRATGRRLLEEVVEQDPDNELAWIWLASCVNTLRERRECLERVLEINPNNPRAREALSKLGGDDAGADQQRRDQQRIERLRQAQRSTGTTRAAPISQPSASGGGLNLRNLAVGLLATGAVLAGLFVASALLNGDDEPQVAIIPTNTRLPPTAIPVTPPTRTPNIFNGTSLAPTLPPTFTPTATETPTRTPTPTNTPFPLSDFGLFISSLSDGEAQPDIYRYLGDGAGESLLGAGVRELAFSPDGETVAFIRDVDYEMEVQVASEATEEAGVEPATQTILTMVPLPELFVANINDLGGAQQVTEMRTSIVSGPTWSPEGREIVFTSNIDGDEELWYITPDGQNLHALTENTWADRDPAWEPVLGSRKIVFASDRDSIGSTEIYSFDIVEPGETPLYDQMTLNNNSSFSPSWSQNGQYIAFISDRGGDPDVYFMKADGGSQTLATVDDGRAEDRNPSFTPDGRFIVFISNREGDRFQSYLVSPDGRTLVRITDNNRNDISLTYRPELLFRIR